MTMGQQTPKAAYESIAELLRQEGRDVISGSMFGKLCLKSSGKAFAAFYEDEMVFKLTEEERERALNLQGAGMWDPSGKHRPMKDWIQVPFAHVADWPPVARTALAVLAD